MENKLRTFLSILSMSLFLFFALASFLADNSSNTTVAIDESKCMTKPTISSGLTVSLTHIDKKSGMPIPFAKGELFYTVQRTSSFSCQYENVSVFHVSFTTDAAGHYNQNLPNIADQHNAADLIRAEIRMDETATYNGGNAIGVAYYGPATFAFAIASLKKSDL
jgi:hypothetical protein